MRMVPSPTGNQAHERRPAASTVTSSDAALAVRTAAAPSGDGKRRGPNPMASAADTTRESPSKRRRVTTEGSGGGGSGGGGSGTTPPQGSGQAQHAQRDFGGNHEATIAADLRPQSSSPSAFGAAAAGVRVSAARIHGGPILSASPTTRPADTHGSAASASASGMQEFATQQPPLPEGLRKWLGRWTGSSTSATFKKNAADISAPTSVLASTNRGFAFFASRAVLTSTNRGFAFCASRAVLTSTNRGFAFFASRAVASLQPCLLTPFI
jgi:hypothetical protein